MSSTEPVVPKNIGLSEEQVERISGGSCTPADYIEILGHLREGYDNLVDFTSYVIERVATSIE